MAWQILKAVLVLLAIFLPLITARIIFRHQFGRWFIKKENSYFSFGFPATIEGYMLSGIIIIIVIILLLIINQFV